MAPHELQRLLSRHHRIIGLLLEGHSIKQIATMVSMTPQAISLISKAPIVQEKLAERRQARSRACDVDAADAITKAKTILEEGATTAAEKLVELVTDGVDHRVQLQASTTVLDRVFGSKEREGATNIVVNTEQLQVLQVALSEAGVVGGVDDGSD